MGTGALPGVREEFENGSLVVHPQTQHDMAKEKSGQVGDEEGKGDKIRPFGMAFPVKEGPRHCPVEGCSGQAEKWTLMRVHFWNRHSHDTVLILEEGKLSHPR